MKTFEEISRTMKELSEYTAMMDDLKAQIETLQDEVKAYMTEHEVDEVVAEDGSKATWRSVLQTRFDSSAFKKSEWAELYKEFSKQTEYKRFTFNR